MGVASVAGSVFIALGKPIPPTVLSILRSIVVYVPLAIVLDSYFGYAGIFAAIALANILFGIAAFLWGRSMLNRELRSHSSVPAAAH